MKTIPSPKTAWKTGALVIAAALVGGAASRALAPLPLASAQDKGPGAPGDPAPPKAATFSIEVLFQGATDVMRYHKVVEWRIGDARSPGFLSLRTQDGHQAYFATEKLIYFGVEPD